MRPYQQECIDILMKLADEGETKGLIEVATGGGKTGIAAMFAQLFRFQFPGRILFLAHMIDLTYQARKEFKIAMSKKIKIGMLIGEKQDAHDCEVVIATFQYMRNHLDEFSPNEFTLLIADEAHHSMADTYKDVILHFAPRFRLGITATVDRMDKKDIREIFGKEVFTYDLAEAIADGYLANIDYRVYTSEIAKEEIAHIRERVFAGDAKITRKALDQAIFRGEGMKKMVEIVNASRSSLQRVVYFCEDIGHCEKVSEHDSQVFPYHSRLAPGVGKHRFSSFEKGEIRGLSTVGKFNEGVNIPTIEHLAFFRKTKSYAIWLHQLGRGSRKTRTKQTAVVHDFVANCDRLMEIAKLVEDVKTRIAERRAREGRSISPSDIELSLEGMGITFNFSQEARDIIDIVTRIERGCVSKYKTIQEAAEAARNLNIGGQKQYHDRYKEDPRLPSDPQRTYRASWESFGKWIGFLGKRNPRLYYETIQEASQAASALEIKSEREYFKRCGADPRLPLSPQSFYENSWKSFGGWYGFLGKKKRHLAYTTIEEASQAAKRLGFENNKQYYKGWQRDPMLPSRPDQHYQKEWKLFGGWRGFLGPLKERKKHDQELSKTLESKRNAVNSKQQREIVIEPQNDIMRVLNILRTARMSLEKTF